MVDITRPLVRTWTDEENDLDRLVANTTDETGEAHKLFYYRAADTATRYRMSGNGSTFTGNPDPGIRDEVREKVEDQLKVDGYLMDPDSTGGLESEPAGELSIHTGSGGPIYDFPEYDGNIDIWLTTSDTVVTRPEENTIELVDREVVLDDLADGDFRLELTEKTDDTARFDVIYAGQQPPEDTVRTVGRFAYRSQRSFSTDTPTIEISGWEKA